MTHSRHKPRIRSGKAGPATPPAASAARISELEAKVQHLREQLALERLNFEAEQEAEAEALRELEVSRERYAGLYDSAPVGYLLLDRNGFIREANLTLAQMLGVRRDKLIDTLLARYVVEHDRRQVLKHLSRCRCSAGSEKVTTELKVAGAGGRELDIALTSVTQAPPPTPRAQVRFRTVVMDITARKQAEAWQAADLTALTRLHELSGRVLEAMELPPLLQEVMDAAVAIAGAQHGTLQLLEGEALRVVAHHRHQPSFLEYFADAENRTSACGEALSRGERVVVPDVETSALFAGTPSLPVLRAAGVRAVQSTPMLNRAGKPIGILTTHWDKPHRPDEHDLWRMDLLVRQAADLIESVRAEAALRESEAQVKLALRAAQAANWSWDLKTNRTTWSPEYYALYGIKPHVTPGLQNWLRCIHPADRKAVEESVKRAVKDCRKEFSFEFRIRHPARGDRWIVNRGRVLYTAQGKAVGATGINLDITERKQVEQELSHLNARLEQLVADRTQALSDAYDRYRAITDSVLVGILTLDERGAVETFNPAAARLFGYLPNEMAGRNISELMTSPDQLQDEAFLAHYTNTPGDQQFMGVAREVLGRRKDGQVIPLELSISDFTHGGQRRFVAMMRDVSIRRRLERELLEVGERERQRIARDLHDGLGQQLAGVSYLAALLTKKLQEEASPCAVRAAESEKYLNEALEQTRGLAHGLLPVKAVPEGLMIALRELAERTSSLYRVDCRFVCSAPVLIRQHTAATHLYRIAQEAVNNALKHGKATRIRIELDAARQRILLRIRDNGVGLSRRAKHAQGMGLYIMQYRANAIRGSLLARRHPQGGTEVVCTVARAMLLRGENSTSGSRGGAS
jgi:PAS domain S-box-containing protein